ncbi:unnamed protein product, partial [Rotaria magnacalcarata]
MSQDTQELSHENKDEGMPINVINSGLSGVTNRPKILSNAGTNTYTRSSAVRNSFSRSLNEQLLNTIVDELKEINQGFREAEKERQNFQYLAFGFI